MNVNVFLVLCQFILVKAFLLHTELLFIAQEYDIYIGDNNIIGGELILFPGARIGNRCVFGTGTIIVAGSFSVGNGCVMSHGCTITQDVPDNSLVVGRRGLIFNK